MNFILKFIAKFKKWIVIFLFIVPFIITFYIQYDENYENEYWDYKVLANFDFNMEKEEKKIFKYELEKLNKDDNFEIIQFKHKYKEEIRKFLPPSNQYRDWNCYKRFNTNTDDLKEIFINNLSVLTTGNINDECFKESSKWWLFVSYIFIYIAVFFTLIIVFIDKVRRWFSYKNHTVIIGLNKYSRRLIKDLSNSNIKIYEKDNNNEFVKELQEESEYITIGSLEYIIEDDIINAKEIFIVNDTDSESMNNLALIVSKFKDENPKQSKIKKENKTKIYIEIKNRNNRVFFDKKGLYGLVDEENNFEVIPFDLNELIVQRMFKNRPLVSNLIKTDLSYSEDLKILIVGFNDLSEEILYNLLKLAHFDLKRYVNVKVIDDDFEKLNIKYNKLIKKAEESLENSSEIFWKLEFLSSSTLYEDETFINIESGVFRFNRVILCDKKLNNSMDILNYINNNYHSELTNKNTIIQLYNEHKNINNRIDNDTNTYKNFFTFGDIGTIVTYENIVNSRLYKVSKTTNDYKEIDKNKKWINTDSFTRESNITEKLHMNIKLNIFNLKIDTKEKDKFKDIDIDTLLNDYICKSKAYLCEIINEKNKADFEKFVELNYIFDNFNKKFNDEKFELFSIDDNQKKFMKKIKLDNINENYSENKSIKIAELFKIIDWKVESSSKPKHVKRKELKLFFNNLRIICGQEKIKNHIICNEEKIKKHYEDLLKCFEDYDKNYENDIIDINSDEFKKMNENYKLEFKKEGLKTREDCINYFESISNIDKDSREAFKKLGEYGNYKIKLNEEQISSIDKLYKEISDYRVNFEFMELENKKIKLNICMLLSSIELFYKIKDNNIKNIKEHIDLLAQLEHKRWNAYHILNGWKRRKIKEKDQIKKEHFDLCDWETLNEEDSYVVKYDYKNIYQIPFVVHCLGDEIKSIEEEK